MTTVGDDLRHAAAVLRARRGRRVPRADGARGRRRAHHVDAADADRRAGRLHDPRRHHGVAVPEAAGGGKRGGDRCCWSARSWRGAVGAPAQAGQAQASAAGVRVDRAAGRPGGRAGRRRRRSEGADARRGAADRGGEEPRHPEGASSTRTGCRASTSRSGRPRCRRPRFTGSVLRNFDNSQSELFKSFARSGGSSGGSGRPPTSARSSAAARTRATAQVSGDAGALHVGPGRRGRPRREAGLRAQRRAAAAVPAGGRPGRDHGVLRRAGRRASS